MRPGIAVPGPAPAGRTERPRRRGELDLLRALVVFGLIPFHAACIFDNIPEDFHITSPEPNIGFTVLVGWASLWGIPLLFMVAGMGVRYALETRSGRAFVVERVRRLLVPLLFGVVVLVPVMVWLEYRAQPGYSESFGSLWLHFFNLRWGLDLPWPVREIDPFDTSYLYFLYYLLVFSLTLLPAFQWLRRPSGARAVERVGATLARPGGILLCALPIAVTEAALGSESDGGWNRWVYLLALFYGFWVALDRRAGEALVRHRVVALRLAVPLTLVYLAWTWMVAEQDLDPFSVGGQGLGLRAVKGVAGWLWLVAILGQAGWLAARRRSRESGVPGSQAGGPAWRQQLGGYAHAAVLPVYLLHEPVVVAIGFVVVRWHAGALVAYPVIVAASLLVTLALYELVVRRNPVTRFLFGMKPQPK